MRATRSKTSSPRFASHRHRRGRSTAPCPSPSHRRRWRRLPESTLTLFICPWRSGHASSYSRTSGIVLHRNRPIFPDWSCTPILARDPVDSIRNVVLFIQSVCAFPARSYLLAVSFAEIVGRGRGTACVGESDGGRIVPELGGRLEGSLFLRKGRPLRWRRRLRS